MGSQSDIEDQMRASGLDNRDHPNSTKIPTLNLTANYWLQGRHGASLELGLADFVEVKGFEEIGAGNYMFLNSTIWSASFNYVFSSLNRKRYLSVGPTLFLHRVKDDAAGSITGTETNWLAGLNASYTAHLIDRSRWFIALKANGRLAPKSEIGPFIIDPETGIINPQPVNHRSEFGQTKVRISGFNIGLTAGLKLGTGT